MYTRGSSSKTPDLTKLQAPELESLGLTAARTSPPDYERLTDVWLELKRRGRNERAESYERQLRKHGLVPVEWLDIARRVARAFQRRQGGKHHVYVVLLEGFARGGPFGVYVGESSRRPETRLEKHAEGGRLAAKCHRMMRGLLHSVFEHLNPLSTEEARELEVKLVHAFEAAGLRVKGPRELKARRACGDTAKQRGADLSLTA